MFECAIEEHLRVVMSLRALGPILERIAAEMTRAVMTRKKVLWCGNGGEVADSQHLAAEFVGQPGRSGLASIAMATDTSVLTSISNDYGYEKVFSLQVEALCAEGDVLVGISTSANSRNVRLARGRVENQGHLTSQ